MTDKTRLLTYLVQEQGKVVASHLPHAMTHMVCKAGHQVSSTSGKPVLKQNSRELCLPCRERQSLGGVPKMMLMTPSSLNKARHTGA